MSTYGHCACTEMHIDMYVRVYHVRTYVCVRTRLRAHGCELCFELGTKFYIERVDVCFMCFRRGYGTQEIEEAFAKYDLDGDKVLDQEEQRKMQDDLEGQRVGAFT